MFDNGKVEKCWHHKPHTKMMHVQTYINASLFDFAKRRLFTVPLNRHMTVLLRKRPSGASAVQDTLDDTFVSCRQFTCEKRLCLFSRLPTAISYRQPSAALFAGEECKQHIEEKIRKVFSLYGKRCSGASRSSSRLNTKSSKKEEKRRRDYSASIDCGAANAVKLHLFSD